jgi:hypothetical protein
MHIKEVEIKVVDMKLIFRRSSFHSSRFRLGRHLQLTSAMPHFKESFPQSIDFLPFRA